MELLQERLRRDWWVLVVVVISVLGTVLRGHDETYPAPGAWAGVLAGLAVVPLLWRDQRPELTVLANAAAVTTYFAWSSAYPDGPIYLSVFFSTYALASRRPRTWLPYAGTALAAIVLALLVREARVDSTSEVGTAARLIWFAMVDTAAAALAVALRSRRETHAEQVRRAATEEQLRMAQDLHDGVGHGLAVIAMQAGVALHVLDQDPAAARRSLEAIRETSRESLEALRAELARLQPAAGAPAPRAPRSGLADLTVLAERISAGGLRVDLDIDPALRVGGLPADVDAAGYTVVQEALTNVLRHSGATVAHVQVRRTGTGVEIAVTDDGRGGTTADEPGAGLGIPGMRSRVAALGGTLEAAPLPGHGFEVRAVLPVEASVEEASP